MDDVVVSCGHLAEGMRRAVAELEPGVDIRYAEEPEARGTAGAIVSGDLRTSSALHHYYNAHTGSCSYRGSEEMGPFTKN